MRPFFPFIVRVAVLGIVLLFFSNCGKYALGPSTDPPFKTLYVEAVTNESFAPQAAPLASSALREAFLNDGRIKLVGSSHAAEATLTLRLTGYRRKATSYDSDDTAKANAFDITLQGQATLSDNRKGGSSLFHNRPIRSVARLAWSDDTLSPDGRQPLAAAIASLSREAVAMTLDVW